MMTGTLWNIGVSKMIHVERIATFEDPHIAAFLIMVGERAEVTFSMYPKFTVDV